MGALSENLTPKDTKDYTETQGTSGTAQITATEDMAGRDLVIAAGLDPSIWTITGDVKVRRWQIYSGEGRVTYSFTVKQSETEESKQANAKDIAAYLRQRTPITRPTVNGSDAYCFVASDWQLGKAYKSIGTEQTARRISDAIDVSVQNIKDLRRRGAKMPTGVIIGLGDIVEQCGSFYSNMQFTIDLNQRDQNRVARELLRYAIDEHYPMFEELVVWGVGGNHGENRQNNAKITDDADNLDVEVFDVLRFAYDMAGVDGITWNIAQQELSSAMTLGGVNVGITHGHLLGGGTNAPARAEKWFAQQVFGMQAVQHSQILLTGHYHHFYAYSPGRRTMLQAPAADPGSAWYTNLKGADTPPGVLTLRFDSEHPLGYDDIRIIG